jgi:nitrogen fixation protein FixH
LVLSAVLYETVLSELAGKNNQKDMKFKVLRKSEGLAGVAIVGGVVIVSIAAVVIFATKNFQTPPSGFSGNEKYAVEAFMIKRQGRKKSKTKYTALGAGAGLSVDVKFNKSDQKLMLNIRDRTGKPMPRVTIDAQASKVGQRQIPRRFAMKEYKTGEYRSNSMDLEKGGWILAVSAYDLFNRGNNKLLFYTEKPLFLK